MAISSNASPFDSIIFDLDDTLYPSSTGIDKCVKKNIQLFLIQKCGFSESEAFTLRVDLFKTYGSTLAGLRVSNNNTSINVLLQALTHQYPHLNSVSFFVTLQALGHDITAEEYHGFVHGRLPYDSINPDHHLRNLLCTIKQRKIVFTNSDRIHAMRSLDRLGIKDCFEQIICFETINPNLPYSTRPDEFLILLKPSLDAFKIALDAANVDPRRTLFLDDSVRNIAAGKEMGLHTVLVGKTEKSKGADYAVECVNDLAQVIPEIWANEMDGEDQTMTRTKSELEAVLACAVVGA
ncbi:hypothetical protein GLYMA_20G144800v4 [Glycine max]|uniref:Uncharacterized protein n=1 Tax=Glycine max TaxID=3847 RepID=I1NGD4_SOYBN|nr:hypothetical protein GYH30_055862 [Glycine max]KRG91277.1 hypothetical protein GLYMA_20G144800v4 [Glycine max]